MRRKQTKSGSLVTVAGLGLSLVAAGCAQNDDASTADCDKTYTLAFSHPVSEAAGAKAVKRGVEEYAKEKGCIKVLLDNTTAFNLETQRAAVEGWVTQQVDAILLWPVDPNAFANLAEQAQGQGTKWLTYVAKMDGEDGSVGFDGVQSGNLITADLKAWIDKHYPDGKGFSAAVTTLTALPTIKGRWEQPLAALDELEVPVVSQQDCAAQDCGLQIAEDALRENPDLRVFIGLNDDVALGAQKAFENAGLSADEVYISGTDGTPEGLSNIKEPGDGAFRVTAAIDLQSLSRDIVDNSLAAITGDGNTNSLTPSILVKTRDDAKIDELLAQMGAG